MTCVAGIALGNNVYMAADSASTDGTGDQTLNMEKLFRRRISSKEDMLIGCHGSVRSCQAVRYGLDIPTPPKRGREGELEAYFVGEFSEALRVTLGEAGCLSSDDMGGDMACGGFLIGFRGRLFNVMPDFAVIEDARGYDAIGSGHAYAKGAMCAIREIVAPINWTPETCREVARRAVEAAADHNAYVVHPIREESLIPS